MSVLQFKEIAAGEQGRDLIEKLKYNFDLITTFADSSTSDMLKRIISNEIKAIKLVDKKIYYTKDYEGDSSVWVDMSPTWGEIIGDITQQTDLVNLLNSKVSTITFNLLDTRVQAVTNLSTSFHILNT